MNERTTNKGNNKDGKTYSSIPGIEDWPNRSHGTI